MNTIIRLVRLALAYANMRIIHTEQNDNETLIREIENADILPGLYIRREELSKEAAAARARYLSYKKPGDRCVWSN